MAEFYLPIKIGQRRMHICHLNNPSENFGFEFIIPIDGPDHELFSFINKARFISKTGTNNDGKTWKQKFTVSNIIEEESLSLKIQFSEPDGKENTPLKFSEHKISFDKDSNGNFVLKASNQITVKKIKVTISYLNKENTEFSYTFTIHTPKANNKNIEIYKAAFDFGSEASQIGYKLKSSTDKHENPVNILDALKKYYPEYKNEKRFWQGNETDESDNLFKSVFFVSKEPQNGYKYSDNPNLNGKANILHTVTPQNLSEEEYSKLYLLPNLKLIELVPSQELEKGYINLNDASKNPVGLQGENIPILQEKLIDSFLRVILSNFIHALLDNLKFSVTTEKYIQVTLLVPNVYSQEKIYHIVRSFYSDFNEIIKEHHQKGDSLNQKFSGIEVFVMSESDASFIGARKFESSSENLRVERTKGAKYLVIDAGKGTTDFSIISQQDTSQIHYDSHFRTGLPGSGQYVSHGFIEALESFLNSNEILSSEDFRNTIIKVKKKDLLTLMKNIETLKRNHSSFSDMDNEELEKLLPGIKSDVTGSRTATQKIESINRFLLNDFISKRKRIPNCTEKIDSKINSLLDEIEKSISKSGENYFHQIILAGRAFLFQPLYEALINRFESRVTNQNNKFIFHKDEHSKSLCIDGAFQGETIIVNSNSELIGSPVILDSKGNRYEYKPSGIAKVTNWIISFFEDDTNSNSSSIDDSFFFNGYNLQYDLSDKDIKIGARIYNLPNEAVSIKESKLIYTGDGFMLQWAEGAYFLSAGKLSHELTKMVKETLFPFAEKQTDGEDNVDSATSNFKSQEKKSSNGSTAIPKQETPKKPTNEDDPLS